MKTIVLYNPRSNNGRGREEAVKLLQKLDDDTVFLNLTELSDLQGFFSTLAETDHVILCGGDGTLNRFVNDLGDEMPACRLSYYPAGSGNDFYNDLSIPGEKRPVDLKPYIDSLPVVTVNGQKSRFLNGVGFGLDGYCCEEGDRQRAQSAKKTNYTLIALKGLLKDYHPVNAKVTVDGVMHTYERVWLAPAMKGRYYGGGLMIAPGQKRQGENLTMVILHDCNKYQILGAFPTIIAGKHVMFKSIVTILEGKDVTVEFDRPNALQIDGETVKDVMSYHAEI